MILFRVLLVVILAWPCPSPAREPPDAGCIDLRDLSGGWRSGPREILVRSRSAEGARLVLDPACPEFPQGVDLETVGPDGWACPGARAWVRGGGNTCLVVAVKPLAEAALSDALRERSAGLRADVTLDPVVVQGHGWRDIRGTTDRCVDARFLRGWREDDDGLVVEVAPKRHSGHRFYRVTTVDACAGLASATSIRLRSRSGGAAVCGHPGDKVLLASDPSPGIMRTGEPPAPVYRATCEIVSVVPLPRR